MPIQEAITIVLIVMSVIGIPFGLFILCAFWGDIVRTKEERKKYGLSLWKKRIMRPETCGNIVCPIAKYRLEYSIKNNCRECPVYLGKVSLTEHSFARGIKQ